MAHSEQLQLHNGFVITVRRAEGDACAQLVQTMQAAISAAQRGDRRDQQMRLQAELVAAMVPYIEGIHPVHLMQALNDHTLDLPRLFAAITGSDLGATYTPTQAA